jgi:hypothetical protein
MAAAVAIYLALFVKHRLAPGEKGMALVLAGSIDQAKTVFGYVRGFLEATPALAREVAAVKRFEIELRNGLVCFPKIISERNGGAAQTRLRWLQ